MEYDAIVVELKVIASIQTGQRLTTRSSFLNIESSSIIPECIRRWKTGDTRNESIKKINAIINNALLHIDSDKMRIYLKDAVVGLKNLQQTYSTDIQTISRLDTIVDKIEPLLISI